MLKQLSSAAEQRLRRHTQEYDIWLSLTFLICAIVFIRTDVHPTVWTWFLNPISPDVMGANLVYDGAMWDFNVTVRYNAFNHAPWYIIREEWLIKCHQAAVGTHKCEIR